MLARSAGSDRDPRDHAALDLLLQVEDRVVALLAQRGAEGTELPPGRTGKRRAAPAAQRQRDGAPDLSAHRRQRRERLLGEPVDGEAGTRRGDVVRDRERPDDVTERRGAHDEDAAHGIVPGPDRASRGGIGTERFIER